jgi:hypothetical protein
MNQIIYTSKQVNKYASKFVYKNTLYSGVYLGRTLVYEPLSNDGASSVSENNSAPDQDGVIKTTITASDNRIIRYQRQSSAQELLPNKRVGKCLKTRIAKTVKVMKSKEHGKCHYGDLMICGSVWDCPVCAGKISERRRVELTRAVEQHKSFGGSVYLITFTYSHKKQDNLQELLEKQAKAMQWFYRHRTYKEIAKRYQKQGRVRALEVNHGENGWHPHIHELWFLDLHLHDFQTLKLEIFNLWLKACQRFDLGLPSWDHGVDVRGGGDAAAYVAKFGFEEKKPSAWGIEHEITKASSKKARTGSRSAFQLLDDYIEGDKQAGALFSEYSKAFHRKKQLTWSRGLKAVFDLDTMTDEELATLQDDEAKLLSTIEDYQWSAVIGTSTPKQDNRVIILTLAETGGLDAMNIFIKDLVIKYKKKLEKIKKNH